MIDAELIFKPLCRYTIYTNRVIDIGKINLMDYQNRYDS